jgi:hypothetical protein
LLKQLITGKKVINPKCLQKWLLTMEIE